MKTGKFDTEEYLSVENFVDLAPHQVWAFNIHLQGCLQGFDEEFQKNGGRIGSPYHQHHRTKFAELVSDTLVKGIAPDESLNRLVSTFQYECPNLCMMEINRTDQLKDTINPIPDVPFPLYNSEQETLTVELFADALPEQSAALNFHLHKGLKGFDKEYQKAGGRIGSIEHRYDRMEFAKFKAQWLATEFEHLGGELGFISDETEYYPKTMGCVIKLKSTSQMGNDAKPVTTLPFYEPN